MKNSQQRLLILDLWDCFQKILPTSVLPLLALCKFRVLLIIFISIHVLWYFNCYHQCNIGKISSLSFPIRHINLIWTIPHTSVALHWDYVNTYYIWHQKTYFPVAWVFIYIMYLSQVSLINYNTFFSKYFSLSFLFTDCYYLCIFLKLQYEEVIFLSLLLKSLDFEFMIGVTWPQSMLFVASWQRRQMFIVLELLLLKSYVGRGSICLLKIHVPSCRRWFF